MPERKTVPDALHYDPETNAGLRERIYAKALCRDYNLLHPGEMNAQREIIRKLFGRAGDNFYIVQPFFCDLGYNIFIGDNFFANHNLVILDTDKVTFGNNVFIGPNCGFYAAEHPIDAGRRNAGVFFSRPISVGDDVWFGGQVAVIPGVNIGSDVVIGAGSVVTRDIPSGVVAAGNPCRVLRKITEADKARPDSAS